MVLNSSMIVMDQPRRQSFDELAQHQRCYAGATIERDKLGQGYGQLHLLRRGAEIDSQRGEWPVTLTEDLAALSQLIAHPGWFGGAIYQDEPIAGIEICFEILADFFRAPFHNRPVGFTPC